MKAKVIFPMLFLFCFLHSGFAQTVVEEIDSLLPEKLYPDVSTDSTDNLAVSGNSKMSVDYNATVRQYSNWYSFERPDALYAKKYLRQSIAPLAAAALGLGILGMSDFKVQLQESLNWNKDLQVPMFEDQIRHAPYAIGLILPLFGKYPKHKLLHLVPLVTGSYLLADGIVNQLKVRTAMPRPNPLLGQDAFPSQHTSMAFVAATILHHEFGDYSPWISIGGYALAGWVAYARVAKNYHWTSDVLVGAAIGTLSTHLVYLSYDFLSDLFTKNNITFYPYLIEGGGGVYLSLSF
ncbi:MAG: phosphatase PAP2 family protein [Bacteroidales bacterium]|nr:phosphatase PAP2 family protein [Bacteroidales bacterium]